MPRKKAKKNLSLDDAKLRLRDAITRLENTVELKLKTAEEKIAEAGKNSDASSATVKEYTEMKERLGEMTEETKHLRDENQGLHSEVGKEQESSRVLKKRNVMIADRIDGLIRELQTKLVKES